jgi:[ribosomal protein S5]-alanine N-acetyltransferase
MDAAPIAPRRIATARLLLRPTDAADAERAFEIQSDWRVTRMLSMASFPPDLDAIRRWFSGHQREWAAGGAYRFGVELRGRLVGMADIDGVRSGEGQLGYWLERAVWGHGYASEAAQAVVRFAFYEAGLSALRSGHAVDNTASAKILLRLGFRPVDTVQRASRSRGETVLRRRYILMKPDSLRTPAENLRRPPESSNGDTM